MTALVTGASSGIGYELAKIFAENKYDVVLVARTKPKLDEIADDFRQCYGVKVYVMACDLSQPEACGYIYGQVNKIGVDVDVLVNNAGLGDWGPFIDSNWEKQENMLQLNVVNLTRLTRFFLPEMIKRRWGRVLNVASTAAFQPGPLMSVYYATKAYVLSFSSGIAQELKGTGVYVTCLCPGPTASGFPAAAAFPRGIRLTHGRRLPSPKEVAEYGYRAMLKGQTVAIHGFLNRLFVLSVRFSPQWLVLRIVHFIQEGI